MTKSKTYRLDPITLLLMEEIAKLEGKSNTDVIKAAVYSYAKNNMESSHFEGILLNVINALSEYES